MSIWTNSTFVSATAGYGNVSQPTNEIDPSISGAGARKHRAQNVMPAAIKSLLNHDDNYGQFQINGVTAGMVCVVGQLRKIEASETKISYNIEDDTGTIEAILWLCGDESFRPSVFENTYVKVIGSMRSSRENAIIMVYRISSVADIHEVTAHLLEVAVTPLRINKIQHIMAVSLQKEMMGAFGISNLMPTRDNVREDQLIAEKKLPTRCKASGDTVFNNFYSQPFGPLRVAGADIVLRLIKSCLINEGITKEKLYTSSNLKRNVVDDAIDYLAGEGYIYSTIDEAHFKSVDA